MNFILRFILTSVFRIQHSVFIPSFHFIGFPSIALPFVVST